MISTCIKKYRFLLIPLLIAFGIRLVYFGLFHDKPTAYAYEYFFGIQALHLLEGKGMTSNDPWMSEIQTESGKSDGTYLLDQNRWPPNPAPKENYYHAFETPGYVWVLAATWLVTGIKGFTIIKAIQFILGTILVVVIYSVGKMLMGHRAGLLAAYIYALWLPSAYLMGVVSKEPWEMILLPITWLTLRYFNTSRIYNLVAMLLLWVLGVYIRGNLFLYMGFLCFCSVPKFGWRKPLAVAGIAYAVVMVSLVPWYFRNLQVLHKNVVLKEDFYFAVFSGLTEYDRELNKINPEFKPRIERNGRRLYLYEDWDPEFKPIVTHVISQRPLWYLETVLRRFIRTLFIPEEWGLPWMTGENSPRFHVSGANLWGRWLNRLFMVTHGMMIPLSLLPFFDREKRKAAFVLVACYFGFVMTYAFIRIESRYIVPHVWSLMILSSAGLMVIWDRIRPKRQPAAQLRDGNI